jgi:formamidopyrimidine-DNA glycosylase
MKLIRLAMPELPEVEVVRRDLEREVLGKRIKTVEVTGARTVRRHRNRKDFIARVEGRKITAVDRKGKYLVLRLDNGDVLVVHLGMSGQLRWIKSAKEPPVRHTHVVIAFPGGQLRYVDPRTFGEMFVTAADQLTAEVDELAHLGFDPLDDAMSWERFASLLHRRSTKLKSLLMDQKFVAGVGNVYSDEVLFEAGLRHDRLSDSLTSQEIRRLYRALVETLQEAVKHRGSSLADEQYVDLFGKLGDFQRHHQVYARAGSACPRCRHQIVRARVGGRSTFYCEACQV